MKTLADLKRKLKVGTKFTMVFNSIGTKKLPWKRQVVSIQSNGVWMIDPNDAKSKKSFLDFPKASLLEVTEIGFKIFEAGRRNLTEIEKNIIANEPRDAKQEEIDILSDGSTMYWRRKQYYYDKGYDYLFNGDKNRRLDNNSNRTKLIDSAIKGGLSLEYVFD